ncbi:hypothetical protein [Deinococcus cellulosilyticus]|uniref:Uncharacterized protein n=1 Tax=Deinococcus cellulosilyticus (strain DSM 18568 / NBRC 106333 / KACC 11606 / 5516J-15) TaxID=1223518 RepID=A0A511N4H1_DEIC1|nr:hypothetical protein [Deinococcus cellulosilyticus]GEM47281.1 hypothetical protein DC3_29160 [Deinococcus cellulosilyticus NBRC 106333 = KACC 11606]
MKLLHLKLLTTTLLLSSAASAATLDSLLKDLKSPEQTTRQNALDELSELSEEGFTEKEGLKILDAAAGKYAANGEYSINAELVSFLREKPSPKLIQPLVALFPKLDADAKWYALDVLAYMEGSKDALKTYLGLVGKHSATLDGLPVSALKEQKDAVKILFPTLFQYTRNPKLQYDIYDLALEYVYEDWMSIADLRRAEAGILNDYRTLATRLNPAQQTTGIAWRWQEPYLDDRYLGGLMLDLIGFLNTRNANQVLQDALKFNDPYLQGWAVISLAYNDQKIPAEAVKQVAASNEMRWTLYDYLQDAEHLDLFPAEYRNQQDMGASDLVNVLIDSDELGYEPESVEFVQKFTRQEGSSLYDYYLYKFTDHEGTAYAGLAGPYSPARVVTIEGGDDTSTLFTRWEEKSPEAHYQAILDDLYGESEDDLE